MSILKRQGSVLVFLLILSLTAVAQWRSIGPEGGDARSFAYDPQNPDRILLGGSDSHLYLSEDNGRSWRVLARLGDRDDYILDHIVISPADLRTIYVAAWSVERPDGDLFVSRDGGASWRALPGVHGKSIRSFALTAANPRQLTVGALDGVFRSEDGGETWRKLTPDNHPDLRNFESLAVDPAHPQTIYAGTWHLAWKTDDGGADWRNLKQGVIDDSDVFSIILDRGDANNVYLSACSGIYKSENAAQAFRKIQGIPGTARRTRVLRQDPLTREIVYAGTTEGLWRTSDAGRSFQLISPPNFILNDVHVDPRNAKHLLIAIDRGGVYGSEDGGATWRPQNRGYVHRQVTDLLTDGGTYLASVINDKEFGGVLSSTDHGGSWSIHGRGLEDREVFALSLSPKHELWAATNRGVYRYAPATKSWLPSNVVLTEKVVVKPARPVKRKKTPPARTQWVKSELSSSIQSLYTQGQTWLAASSSGLYASRDEGSSWIRVSLPKAPKGGEFFRHVDGDGERLAATTTYGAAFSEDGGAHWRWLDLPRYLDRINMTLLRDGRIWMLGDTGLYISRDAGASYERASQGMPGGEVVSLRKSADGEMVAAAKNDRRLYISADEGRTWKATAAAKERLNWGAKVEGAYVGATALNGLFRLEP